MLGSPVIGLVPARGGSKGVPRKNLRDIDGQSLVQRTVRSAQAVGNIHRVVVSSDDRQILSEAGRLGALAHERHPDAATDASTATQVVADYIRSLSASDISRDPSIVYLQPTSPLRTAVHIAEALELVAESTTSICISFSVKSVPLKKLVGISLDGTVQIDSDPTAVTANRQTLAENRFLPNGAIYVFRISDFARSGTFPISGGIPYWMDPISSLDIDTEEDLRLCGDIVKGTLWPDS